MNDQELNRAVQYVTASTSYSRETVAEIIQTGFAEMTALATTSTKVFERGTLLEIRLPLDHCEDRSAGTPGS